jgi:hypothetical protein
MKRLLKGILLLALLAGAVALAKSYLEQTSPARTESVQMFFDDGSSVTLQGDSVKAQEFEDIAHKVLEVALADGQGR